MNTENTHADIDATITELVQLVDSFSPDQINMIPSEGSWTAGQLAQHLVMSNGGFVEIINGPVKETERKPDEMVEKIRTVFLNFEIKMNSPDFVVPPVRDYNKEELLSKLHDINKGVDKSIETLNLTKTCLAFELPELGFLTRLEAINFILYHTKRHIHQLKNIHQKVEMMKD